MRENCRQNILALFDNIKQIQSNKKCPSSMLIIDDRTKEILTSLVSDFFSLGVKNITKISLKKKPEPNNLGIYFICEESLPFLIEDFKKQPLYHSINLLICESISENSMKILAQNKKITQRIAFFGELHLQVNFLTSNIGLFCEKNNILKSIIEKKSKYTEAVCSQKLLNALICGFGDNISLKIYSCHTQYSQLVVKNLKETYKQQQQKNQPSKQISLVIFDRSIDLVSSLVRNYYYLTLISDLFGFDYKNSSIQISPDKKIKVNLQDMIFQQYKNVHISKVNTQIQLDFKKFKSQNKAAQMKVQSNFSNLQLKQVIKDLPQYNRKVKEFQQHIQILLEINRLSKQQNLPQLGQLQQMIVSGYSGHGEELKDKKIIEKAFEYCSKLKNQDTITKIMILILFCLDCSESNKKNAIQRIRANEKYEKLALWLEQKFLKMNKPQKLKPDPNSKKTFLNLHQPRICTYVKQLIEKGSTKNLSFTSLGTETADSKFSNIIQKQAKQWVICMLGGISINEICLLERMIQSYEGHRISILATQIYTSFNYLNFLNEVANFDI